MLRTMRTLARLISLVLTLFEGSNDFIYLLVTTRGRITPGERAAWLHRWSSKLLRRWGIRICNVGMPPAAGLIVSNHLSYMDVLLYSAVRPCVFVSKSEVRRWPVFGSLARAAGTIFVNRTNAKDSRKVTREIEMKLREGLVVVLFPEGTSSGGSSVLPFRSALFEAAMRSAMPITPTSVTYSVLDGCVETDVCYWGDMVLVPHLIKLLSREGVAGCVRFGLGIQGSTNRKEAARTARDAVARLAAMPLAYTSAQYDGQVPGVASSTR